MRVGVTMPMNNHPLRAYPEMARAAEDAGFDSVWSYEVYENPLIVLATAALATSRIQLGTGIVTTLSRTPFEMANAAADVDELSDGRLLLGVGLGIPGLMATLHGAEVDHRSPGFASTPRRCAAAGTTSPTVTRRSSPASTTGSPRSLATRWAAGR